MGSPEFLTDVRSFFTVAAYDSPQLPYVDTEYRESEEAIAELEQIRFRKQNLITLKETATDLTTNQQFAPADVTSSTGAKSGA